MNQKRFVNIVVIIGVVILAGIAGYFILNQRTSTKPVEGISSFDECAKAGYPVGESNPRQCWTPDGKHFVEGTPTVGPVTTNGKTTCLTKKGSGQQTMECSIGLQGTDGRHYVLTGYDDPGYKFAEVGLDVRVSGMFTPGDVQAADGNKYDVVGTIDVTSIKEVATFEESNTVLSINSLSPKQGPVGTKITIRGTRFNTRGNVVAFGPVNIGGIDSPDRMTISFTIPSFGSSSCTAGDRTMCTRDAISIFPGEHKVVVKTTEGISNSFLFIVTQ